MAFPNDYRWKFRIPVDATQVDGSLTDFPVMVLLEDVPESMMDAGAESCLNGGGDIRAGNEDGTLQYPLEVVRCVTSATPASRALELHIKIPTVSASADTDKRISDHELRVAEHYVRVENFTRLETRILEKLERIEKKIDAKADKQVHHDPNHF